MSRDVGGREQVHVGHDQRSDSYSQNHDHFTIMAWSRSSSNFYGLCELSTNAFDIFLKPETVMKRSEAVRNRERVEFKTV